MNALLDTLPLAALLPDPDLLEWIGVPLTVLVVVGLLLWSGKIRQKLLVNVLALGVMLPMMQFCLIAAAGHTLSEHLRFALLDLVPAWLG
ncbi:hypothetical protein [Alloalcanivorax mobilis]|uniref:hypothetical protein n=1 Tax=Alloalcanivorax mobilis TaxID=2019569 RepID=UPI000B5B122B|nr:hypothetical protein [Alloalcanivorax mobilis]ASK36255.1 hypothetical protein CEK62_18645 [Alcanivorax sp. N3-2A]|tara:strand:- start:2619 stop:2888 length:270 start_codon:yes stop_codon:yes gene_type:complete